ncbi:MAG: hypothetical protein ACLTXM_11965 [Enterococcus sp.]
MEIKINGTPEEISKFLQEITGIKKLSEEKNSLGLTINGASVFSCEKASEQKNRNCMLTVDEGETGEKYSNLKIDQLIRMFVSEMDDRVIAVEIKKSPVSTTGLEKNLDESN